MRASSTGWPAPSSTRPSMHTALGWSAGTRRSVPGTSRPMWKKGPIVCGGVAGSCISAIHGGCRRTPQHNVPAVAEGPFRLGDVEVEDGNQPFTPLPRGDGLEDRVVVHQ